MQCGRRARERNRLNAPSHRRHRLELDPSEHPHRLSATASVTPQPLGLQMAALA